MNEGEVPAEVEPRRPPRSELRVANEPGLVLHSYPYKETSLIVEVLTRHHGRVAVIARGAKRPRSALRGVLLAFRPLSLSWSRARNAASDLVTLTRAEWLGGLPGLEGSALVCGFYLNELLIRLLARDDPHESLFDAYFSSLAALAGGAIPGPVLREFEYALLREIGYGLQLTLDANGQTALDALSWYQYIPERGPVPLRATQTPGPGAFLGKTLYDIAARDYSDPRTLVQSKLLMRQLLAHHLGGQTLHTRQMMLDLNDL